MSESRWKVPESWAWVASGEISRIVGGGTPTTSDQTNFSNDAVAWITPADLSGYRETYISKGKRDLSEKGYQSSSATKVPPGTVLYSSRAPIGYCVIAAKEISTSQGFKNFILKGGISPEYIRYYLLSSVEYAESLARGTTFKELSGARAAQLSIPLSPLPEQRRIVAKLDSLISRTAHARVALDQVPALIEKYKQTTLRKAFSGDLAAGWKNNKGTSKSTTVHLGDVVADIRYGTAKKSYPERRGTAVIRIPNVAGGQINLTDLKYTNFDEKELRKLALQSGDILVVRSNGSSDLVGRPALITEAEAGLAYAGYLIRLRPNVKRVYPAYLKYMLDSPQIRKKIKYIVRSSNGIHNINSGELSSLELPCPELGEQIEIVHRIEADFAWLGRVSDEHLAASKLISTLDPSIFQAAFKGELVPQNPHDEPASILLERIKAESGEMHANTKSGRKTMARAQKPIKRGARMADLIEVLKTKGDWVSASNAAQALGIGDGATSDAVEEFYNELRMHLQNGHVEVERRGDEDWLRLMPISEE